MDPYLSVLASIPCPILVHGDGRVLWANEFFHTRFGTSDDNTAGRSIGELLGRLGVPLAVASLVVGGASLSGLPVAAPISDGGMAVLKLGQTQLPGDGRLMLTLSEQAAVAQGLEEAGRAALGLSHSLNASAQTMGDNLAFLEQACRAVDESVEPLMRLHEKARDVEALKEVVAEVDERLADSELYYFFDQIPSAISDVTGAMAEMSRHLLWLRQLGSGAQYGVFPVLDGVSALNGGPLAANIARAASGRVEADG